uniref:Uncharacterized protein n=1 Tax=Arundo donax TaxID=35708 RepID=A0A0A9GTQ9_ARUDO
MVMMIRLVQLLLFSVIMQSCDVVTSFICQPLDSPNIGLLFSQNGTCHILLLLFLSILI